MGLGFLGAASADFRRLHNQLYYSLGPYGVPEDVTKARVAELEFSLAFSREGGKLNGSYESLCFATGGGGGW